MLGNPKDGAPSADQILAGLFREEQWMHNRINGGNAALGVDTLTITTVVNQADYTINATAGHAPFGKAWFLYRDVGNNVIVPVPFTDYTNELNRQSYEFISVPIIANEVPGQTGEKIAFYRTAAGLIRARIFPIPEIVGRIYTVVYATGAIDPSVFDWTDVPILPEWSTLRCMRTALFQLGNAEWKGFTREENRIERQDRKGDLKMQIGEQEPEFNDWMKSPQNESSIQSVGAWFD